MLTSPATATDASEHQPHLSQQSAVTAQVSSERREMARLFPFYRQGATAVGMRSSSRQPFKRFRPSASASGLKKLGNPKKRGRTRLFAWAIQFNVRTPPPG